MTTETREQREARVQNIVEGFVRGWYGNAAAFITPEEMLNFTNAIAEKRENQFIHRLLCLTHNLMVTNNLYMGMQPVETDL